MEKLALASGGEMSKSLENVAWTKVEVHCARGLPRAASGATVEVNVDWGRMCGAVISRGNTVRLSLRERGDG